MIWSVKLFTELSAVELYKILQAREAVFSVEQEVYYVDIDNLDLDAIHIFCIENNEIAAYCRLLAPNAKYPEPCISRVLTSKNFRRIGYGKALMKMAIEKIEESYNTNKVRISAQDYLLEFYQSFGFEDTGKKYLEDTIPHTEMLRK